MLHSVAGTDWIFPPVLVVPSSDVASGTLTESISVDAQQTRKRTTCYLLPSTPISCVDSTFPVPRHQYISARAKFRNRLSPITLPTQQPSMQVPTGTAAKQANVMTRFVICFCQRRHHHPVTGGYQQPAPTTSQLSFAMEWWCGGCGGSRGGDSDDE